MKPYHSLLFALLVGCSSPQTTPTVQTAPPVQSAPAETPAAPKRIILMIGDGMGLNYVTAGAYANGAPLHMMQMPEFNAITVHEYEYAATDSAASATAFATGRKTHYEGVSVTPGTTAENETDPARHMTTLLEHAHKKGWKTGLVATTRIVHATPAAFASHRANRDSYEEIALDMAGSGVDLLMGAGSSYFNKRKDGRALLDEMKAAGYGVALDVASWDGVTANKAVALFEPKDLPLSSTGKRPMGLPQMVDEAIEFLDRDNPEGWVLVVEGSQIDWCGHDLDAACAVAETLDFDDAVGRALAYGRARKDTLVVTTADHETGGLTVIDPRYAERFTKVLGGEEAIHQRLKLPSKDGGPQPDALMHFKLGDRSGERVNTPVEGGGPWGLNEVKDARMSLTWGHLSLASRPFWKEASRFYGAHTVAMIPVFAEGPGAAQIVAQQDNADVGRKLFELVDGAADAPKPVDTKAPKNVIVMIGDGYGFNSMAFGNYVLGDLQVRKMPVTGFVSTHGVDRLVNDSAATATTIATGHRTRGGATGMVVKDGVFQPGYSVLRAAEEAGMVTGLVTTTQLTHATPAAFYGNRETRDNTTGLAADFVGFAEASKSDGVDVVIAGGRAHFSDAQVAALKKQGFDVRETYDPSPAANNVAMLLAPEGLAGAKARLRGNSPQPSLAEMTRYATENLARENKGFFLMVEGGQIDWKLHDGVRDDTLVAEIEDFDLAVAQAMAFAEKDGNTLVIVTADHDHTISIMDNHYIFSSKRCGAEARCGGPFKVIELPVAVDKIARADGFRDPAVRGEWPQSAVFAQYAWLIQEGRAVSKLSAPHSAHMVPLYSMGPWSSRFAGHVDQPELGNMLHEWVRTTSDE